MRRATRAVAALLTAVGAALWMAGCGISSSTSEPPAPTPEAVQISTAHNAADVMYLQMMIAHHGQGLELVGLAGTRAQQAEIKTLAAAVQATQDDEVTVMRSWLDTWSKPAAVDHDPAAHAEHGGLPATGPEQIAALRDAPETDFDRSFINLFVAHQHNAVEMSQWAEEKGENPEVRDFARRVRESRADQIAQLLAYLNN